MCGRFAQYSELDILIERFGFDPGLITIEPRYNIAPGQNVHVVVQNEGKYLRPMRWGLVPSWAKDESIGYRMINARAETVAEKPSFKKPLKRQRCLVLADGFYEWKKDAGKKDKVPMYIRLKTGEPFAFAGLWDGWKKPEGEILNTFTIITTQPNELISTIHDRMPVILRKEDEDKWLNPEESNTTNLLSLLRPYRSDDMEMYGVSKLVNSPKYDEAHCIKEVEF